MPTLSSILVQRGAASMRAVEEAIARQVLHGGDLPTNLLELGAVSEEVLTATLAETFGLAPAPAGRLPAPPDRVLAIIPGDLALRHCVFPLSLHERTLVIATAEPLSNVVEDDLGFALDVTIEQLAAPLVRVRQAIAEHYGIALDRRLTRLAAKLSGLPDPSPSTMPPPERGNSAFKQPRPISVPVPSFGTGVPSSDIGDESPAAGAVARMPQIPPNARAPSAFDPSEPSSDLTSLTHELSSSPSLPLVDVSSAEGRMPESQSPVTAPLPFRENRIVPATVPVFRPLSEVVSPPSSTLRGAAPSPGEQEAVPEEEPRPILDFAGEEEAGATPPPAAVKLVRKPNPLGSLLLAGWIEQERKSSATLPAGGRDAAEKGEGHAGSSAASGFAAAGRSSSVAAGSAVFGSAAASASAGAGARPYRRRGPFSAEMAEGELATATTIEAILEIFFTFSLQYFEFAALFVLQGDIAEGRAASGPRAARGRITGIGIPLDLPSSLARARERRGPLIGPLSSEGLDADLARDLDRSARTSPADVALIPVVVKNRTIAILYGDDGELDVVLSELGDVIAFTGLAATALERIALRKKLGAHSPSGAPPPLGIAPPERAKRAPSVPRSSRMAALAKALSAPSSMAPPSEPTMVSAGAPRESHGAAKESGVRGTDASLEEDEPTLEAVLPFGDEAPPDSAEETALRMAAHPTLEMAAQSGRRFTGEAPAQSGAHPTLEMAAQSQTNPTLEMAAQSQTNPMLELAAHSETRPTMEMAAQSQTNPTLEIAAQSQTNPTLEIAAQSESRPTREMAAESGARRASEQDEEIAVLPLSEPSAKREARGSSEAEGQPKSAEPSREAGKESEDGPATWREHVEEVDAEVFVHALTEVAARAVRSPSDSGKDAADVEAKPATSPRPIEPTIPDEPEVAMAVTEASPRLLPLSEGERGARGSGAAVSEAPDTSAKPSSRAIGRAIRTQETSDEAPTSEGDLEAPLLFAYDNEAPSGPIGSAPGSAGGERSGRRGSASSHAGRIKQEGSLLEPFPRTPPPNATAWTSFPEASPPPLPLRLPLPDRPLRREEEDEESSRGVISTELAAPLSPVSSKRQSIDIGPEFSLLFARVVEGGAGSQEAFNELIRSSDQLLQPLMTRFPGPLRVDRHGGRAELPIASQCGSLLALLVAIRRPALPFVSVRTSSPDVEIRFWATHLLGELRYPEAANVLVPRLFDDDTSVRRIARRSAAALVAAGAAGAPILKGLDNITRSLDHPTPSRILAIETIGEIRAGALVPTLIAVLSDPSEDVGDAARRALLMVSRQDFGRDDKLWLKWWAKNEGRHRVEWLIDALMHEQPSLRRAAGDELKLLTKEYFGYYDDLPKKERERAHGLYREWWEREGRSRFS